MQVENFIDPRLLEDSASHTEVEDLIHNFTDDEITELKEYLADLHIDMQRIANVTEVIKEIFQLNSEDHITAIEMAIQDVKSPKMGYGTKHLKSEIAKFVIKINKGYEEKPFKVYYLSDFENYKIHKYDAYGHYMSSRPMKADEKQKSIVFPSLSKVN
jgi:hypothetical protein